MSVRNLTWAEMERPSIRMPTEDDNEVYVRRLLRERFGVELRKIEESGTKTADYEILSNSVRVAVLEVKTFVTGQMTEANGWTRIDLQPGVTQWEREREDKAPGRVASRLHEAVKQLTRYDEPRVLVFLNDDTLLDVGDLEEACNGYMMYGTDETGYLRNVAWSKRTAVTRIAEEKHLIDLYIWIDRLDERHVRSVCGEKQRTPGEMWFRIMTSAGERLACEGFRCPMPPAQDVTAPVRGGRSP